MLTRTLSVRRSISNKPTLGMFTRNVRIPLGPVRRWHRRGLCFFFFFSSRRRHTRYWRDWSSDVCSSDLADTYLTDLWETRGFSLGFSSFEECVARGPELSLLNQGILDQPSAPLLLVNGKIGRASCRERV